MIQRHNLDCFNTKVGVFGSFAVSSGFDFEILDVPANSIEILLKFQSVSVDEFFLQRRSVLQQFRIFVKFFVSKRTFLPMYHQQTPFILKYVNIYMNMYPLKKSECKENNNYGI